MTIGFEKYAQEGKRFIKQLAEKPGPTEETQRTGIINRAVLHTLRDRLTVSEAMGLMGQLPVFLKRVFIEGWTCRVNPTGINTLDEFTEEIKRQQDRYGECRFDRDMATAEIIHTVLHELRPYISKGETRHYLSQLPEEIKKLVEESIN